MDAPFRQLTPYAWVAQSRVYATNSGIFVDNGEAYLVDPGITPAELERIVAFVATQQATIRGIVLTHAHWDHLLGPTRLPGTPVIAHAGYAAVVAAHHDDLVRQITAWQLGEGAEHPDVFALPSPDMTFDDHIRIHLSGYSLSAIAAPGHAPDALVLYEPVAGFLWAGDMLSDIEVPMVMDTFHHYRQTLEQLARFDIRVLVPGHGSATANDAEIQARIEHDRTYLASLEMCVASAVDQGASLCETVARCSDIGFVQPDSYPNAHRWNIEQAYLEVGGIASGTVGWAQDWLVEEMEC